jgi:hypothetical protein
VFFSNLVQPGNQYGPDGLGIGHTPAYLVGDTGEVLAQRASLQVPHSG